MQYESGLDKTNWPINTNVEFINEKDLEVMDEIGRGSSSRVFNGKLYGKFGNAICYKLVAVRQLMLRSYECLNELNVKIYFEFRYFV